MTTTIDIELYQQQFDFFVAPDKNAAFVGGIGSGKTIAGCMRAIAASQGLVGGAELPVPNFGMVTAPTYPMLRDATLRTFMNMAGDAITDFNKSEYRAVMRGGSEIVFRSAENPDRLRGPSISWWFGDEAALYVDMVWRVMAGRLREGGRRGWAWVTTTPKGRNWVWQRFVKDGRDDYRLFRASTGANPFIEREFYEDLRATYTGAFAAQELDGEFVSFEGLVYEEFSRDVHVWRGELPTFKRVIAGVDWGYSNPAVVLLMGLDYDNRVIVFDEWYQRRVRLQEHAARARALGQQWKVETFYCDPSEPEHINEFKLLGLDATGGNNAVLAGIQAVKARLARQGDGRPRLYVTPGCANLMSEFESYAWREKRNEGLTDQPEKVNDHAMDALRYAVMALDSGADPHTVYTF